MGLTKYNGGRVELSRAGLAALFRQLWARVMLAVTVRVDDSPGWEALSRSGDGPRDRDWSETVKDLEDALEAWRKNFLIRQIVRLTSAFVVGDGFKVSAGHPWVSLFAKDFYEHEQNRIDERLEGWCDELTRSGELFLALFTNKVDGMSYVRELPASSIVRVKTAVNDYERVTGFEERVLGDVEPRLWRSKNTAVDDEPILLHYKVNRVVGATRGESDLTPILPWARRYVQWLKDRVRFNYLRTKLSAVVVTVDDNQVSQKQSQYDSNPPVDGAVVVKGRSEDINFPASNVRGYDAGADGKALRLAFAAGGNVPLHFLSEGSDSNRATAVEMGDPTRRHYRMRQNVMVGIIKDLIKQAYRRKCAVGSGREPSDYGLRVEVTEVSREDNTVLAEAAGSIVSAFATMKANGWVDDETAVRLSFKFAGEVLPEDKIKEILDNGQSEAEGK